MRPAPRRPGNSSTWSVMRAPAESTSQKTGSSWRSACSVSRTIFSTVRAPHDPAFTVGSLAMTHTGRPSTRPTPVTTPSAGRSSARLLASSPSSTNESLSSSSARRSRTKSLPWAASLSPALSRFPASARSVSRASCSCASGRSLIASRSCCFAAGRSGLARSLALRDARSSPQPCHVRRIASTATSSSSASEAKSRAASSRFLHSTPAATPGSRRSEFAIRSSPKICSPLRTSASPSV